MKLPAQDSSFDPLPVKTHMLLVIIIAVLLFDAGLTQVNRSDLWLNRCFHDVKRHVLNLVCIKPAAILEKNRHRVCLILQKIFFHSTKMTFTSSYYLMWFWVFEFVHLQIFNVMVPLFLLYTQCFRCVFTVMWCYGYARCSQ